MWIDTRAIGFALTDAILRDVEGRLESAVGPFTRRRILKATVRLEDVNADRGGDDKRCSIVVALRRTAEKLPRPRTQTSMPRSIGPLTGFADRCGGRPSGILHETAATRSARARC